jgi:aryl-alcohol dehydrogenase-like predicted oxidoreductase
MPGTRHVRYLDENLGAIQIRFSQYELRRLEESFPMGAAAGERYHAQGMQAVNK